MTRDSVLADFTVAHTSTPRQVARALTDAIMRGELVPGMRVRESSLATRLGVSRNSVREAVRIMEQSGLVRRETNRGAVVSTLTLDEVSDLYRVRELVECQAAARAVAPDALAGVGDAVDRLRAALHADPVDLHQVVEEDLGFHAAIVALLGSPSLDRFFAEVCAKLRFYLAVLSMEDQETDRPDELCEQHAAVLRALRDGDRRAAQRLLRDHIRVNAARVTGVMASREGGTGA